MYNEPYIKLIKKYVKLKLLKPRRIHLSVLSNKIQAQYNTIMIIKILKCVTYCNV